MSNLLTSFFFELAKQKKLIKQAEDGPADLERNKKSAELAKKLIVNLVREMDGKTQGAFAKNVGQDVTVFQAQSGVSGIGLPENMSGLRMQHIKSLGAFLQYLFANQVKVNGENVVVSAKDVYSQGWTDEQINAFINNPNIMSLHELTPDSGDQGFDNLNVGSDSEYPQKTQDYDGGDFNRLTKEQQDWGKKHILRVREKEYYVLNNKAQNACYCWDKTSGKYAGKLPYQQNMDSFDKQAETS